MNAVPLTRSRIPLSLRHGFPLASAALAVMAITAFYVAAVAAPHLVPAARLLASFPVALASYRRRNWGPGLAYTAFFAVAFLWQASWAAAAGHPSVDVPGALVATFVTLAVSFVVRGVAASRERRETLEDAARERGELLERATSLDQVAAFICAEAVASLQAADAGLLIRNPVDDRWEMYTRAGITTVTPGGREERQQLAVWLAERERATVIGDTRNDDRFEGDAGFRSLLARPLRDPQGALIALLILTHPEPGQFLPEDQAGLDALAALAETALGHASSYERSGWHNERLATQLAAIQRTARELNANLAPTAIAGRTLECALDITLADAGAILLTLEGLPPVTSAINGQLDTPGLRRLEAAVRAERPEADAIADGLVLRVARRRLIAPIRRESRELGALMLESARGGAFTMQDQQAIAALASHAAVALENARLLREVQGLAQFQRDLLATFSHELRAPLANISALAEVALADPTNKPPPEVLEMLKAQSRRLAALSQRTLTAERLDEGVWPLEIRPLAVAALAREAAHRWQGATPSRTITVRGAEAPGWAWGDEDATALILDNLLENAVKHSTVGAPITVALDRGPGSFVRIAVEDCGELIPERERSALFERFYRRELGANRKTYGVGLGLYIVRQLSEAMGGKAWVEPAGEAGNRFAFSLPVMEESDEDPGDRG
jgi:signal transduction histidine kinase